MAGLNLVVMARTAGKARMPCRVAVAVASATPGRAFRQWAFVSLLTLGCLLLAGCGSPIGADRVTTQQAFAQIEANALRTGRPSASTVAILHRYDLDLLAAKQPDEAVRQLHAKAVTTGERALLFALAEMSHVAGNQIRRSVKPWDQRDARDYHLGSAVYAWLFLFGEGKDAPPDAFDRRFRAACDLYNCNLGLALTTGRTNTDVQLQSSLRRLPVGQIQIQLSSTNSVNWLAECEQFLLADQMRVRGLSVRNRIPGLGAPLVAIHPLNAEFRIRPSSPATVLLRGPASLSELASGTCVAQLETYSPFDTQEISLGRTKVPLEQDLTMYRAYPLRESRVWMLGPLYFLAPAERVRNQLILSEPPRPGRIPVVFVHGTFSSPVTWAEMANSLTADPVLRDRYQIWNFIYGSSNPLMQSLADLRLALTDKVEELDPAGTNQALRQMVVIGHSQGGLLTKGTAIHSGDRFWRIFSTNSLENLALSDKQNAEIRRLMFLEPLPFVKRVVFIATPHQGSYRVGGFVRRLGHRVVSLPANLVTRGTDMMALAAGSEAGKFFQGVMPTSLDGMSPKNPALVAMADIPVAPGIKAHSIIPVAGDGDYHTLGDGIVSYESAHLEGVESEFIVRWKHTCLDEPATIEEVRRILHEHLRQLPSSLHPPIDGIDSDISATPAESPAKLKNQNTTP